MFVKSSLMFMILLTTPLLATTPKLPSINISKAISNAIGAGDATFFATTLSAHKLQPNSVIWEEGHTLLHDAVVEDSPEIVEYLIKNDAQVNDTNKYDDTPLDLATVLERAEIVELLQQAGATHGVNFNTKKGSLVDIMSYVLLNAAQNGYTERIEKLSSESIEALDHKAVVIRAVRLGNADRLKKLIKHGVNPHIDDKD